MVQNTPQNIVIASGIYPPDIGGMATVVKKLSELLSQRGFAITVVTYGSEDKIERPSKASFFPASPTSPQPSPRSEREYTVYSIGRNRSLPARYWRYFVTLYKASKNCGLIYGQDLVSSGIPAAIVSILRGKKLVLRLGGDFLWEKMFTLGVTNAPLDRYYELPKSFREKTYLFIYSFVLARARAIIFNSILQADLYRKYFDLSGKIVRVAHNPLLFSVKPRPEIGGDIVFAGRFIRYKNLEMLIRAYAALSTERKLLLVGDGPLENEYKKLAASLNVVNKVKILSSMDHGQLQELLGKSYLVVIPSLTEINPNLAVEALSVGTPVLITEFTGLLPQLKDRLITFDPRSEDELRSKLEYLLQEKNYRQYLGNIAGMRFDHSWEDVVAENLKVFDELK